MEYETVGKEKLPKKDPQGIKICSLSLFSQKMDRWINLFIGSVGGGQNIAKL